MRVHSAIGLVTNSSGEVFVARGDQIPENLDEMVRTLWKVWFERADDWERDKWTIDTDPAPWFQFDTLANEDEIHYGRGFTQVEAIISFLDKVSEAVTEDANQYSFIASLDSRYVLAAVEDNPDIDMVCSWFIDLEDKYEAERQEARETGEQPDHWMWPAKKHVAEFALEAGLYDDIEAMAKSFADLEGVLGQWKWVLRDFRLYRAYQQAEYVGEIDDHIYPQSFVHFVSDTLGWYCYHNG